MPPLVPNQITDNAAGGGRCAQHKGRRFVDASAVVVTAGGKGGVEQRDEAGHAYAEAGREGGRLRVSRASCFEAQNGVH